MKSRTTRGQGLQLPACRSGNRLACPETNRAAPLCRWRSLPRTPLINRSCDESHSCTRVLGVLQGPAAFMIIKRVDERNLYIAVIQLDKAQESTAKKPSISVGSPQSRTLFADRRLLGCWSGNKEHSARRSDSADCRGCAGTAVSEANSIR